MLIHKTPLTLSAIRKAFLIRVTILIRKIQGLRRHSTRNILLYSSIGFIIIGLLLAIIAWFVHDQFWQSLLLNVGTEFIGGVILTYIFILIDSQPRRARGISYQSLAERFRYARDEIKILTTFSYLFVTDFLEEGIDSYHLDIARQSLLEAIGDPSFVKARFLILNPDSSAAHNRQRERPEVNVLLLLQKNIDFLTALISTKTFANLEVRVYSSLPRISLIQIDNFLSISFFERGVSISKTERYEVSTSTPMARFFEASFDSLWDDTETVALPLPPPQKKQSPL